MATSRLTGDGFAARPVMERGRTGSTVAQSVQENAVWSVNHPQYQMYTELLVKNLREIKQREGERRATAQPALLTVGLSVPELSEVQAAYPEFQVVPVPMAKPPHSQWTAARAMADYYASCEMGKYTDDYTDAGGSVLTKLVLGHSAVHLEVDSSNAVAVHEDFRSARECVQLVRRPEVVVEALGRDIDRRVFTEFLSGNLLQSCRGAHLCQHKSVGGIYDLTLNPMSVTEVAASMDFSGQRVAVVKIPYVPEMLVNNTGFLSNCEVSFERRSDGFMFKYPEGLAGATWFSIEKYASWLIQAGVERSRGRGGYQLELITSRLGILFARMVRVDVMSDQPYFHALDMPESEGMSVVCGWLYTDLTRPVTDDKAWVYERVPVPTRVLERVREHGLSMAREDFSRYAIRRRLQVANNRTVVQGTTVRVNQVLETHQLDALSVFLFAEIFAARYEMGTLAKGMAEQVDRLVGFVAASPGRKIAAVVYGLVVSGYDATFGAVNRAMRSFFDGLRRFFGAIPQDRTPHYEKPPEFMLLSEYAAARRGLLSSVWAILAGAMRGRPSPGPFRGGPLAPYLVGRPVSGASTKLAAEILTSSRVVVDEDAFMEPGPLDPKRDALLETVRRVNEMGRGGPERFTVDVVETVGPDLDAPEGLDYDLEPNYIQVASDIHEAVCTGVRGYDYAFDSHSLSLDDQHRTLQAQYMRLPGVFEDLPRDKWYFRSNIAGYGVPKRQATATELVSALGARNLNAPVLSVPQDINVLRLEVWENFLDTACVSDARDKLFDYAMDPMALDEGAYANWLRTVPQDGLAKLKADIEANGDVMEQYGVERYTAMLKADVKPPVSDKPLHNRVEPQVIVYHDKAINGFYSSILRVLVRRFLSLLKPEILVNLTKDMQGVETHINANHVWGAVLKYLENDFGKYDKSQGEIALSLEEFVYQKLGMNYALLRTWMGGHVRSKIAAVTLGIALSTDYQRKSGDASTSTGNGIINIMSVMYAYRGTDIVWAVFQGDDSIICARTVAGELRAPDVLAEVFNLQAKFFITRSPYFASNFILVHDDRQVINCVPDPIKRIEKWQGLLPGDFDMWTEKFCTERVVCGAYLRRENVAGLEEAISERYAVAEGHSVAGAASVISTAISSYDRYRAIWEAKPTLFSA